MGATAPGRVVPDARGSASAWSDLWSLALRALTVLTVLMVTACASCPEISTTGLVVHVRDAETGEPICDALVMANEEGVQRGLNCASNGAYAGVWDSPGVYLVRVTRSGYVPAERTVRIPTDDCDSVVPQHITISLQAEAP